MVSGCLLSVGITHSLAGLGPRRVGAGIASTRGWPAATLGCLYRDGRGPHKQERGRQVHPKPNLVRSGHLCRAVSGRSRAARPQAVLAFDGDMIAKLQRWRDALD